RQTCRDRGGVRDRPVGRSGRAALGRRLPGPARWPCGGPACRWACARPRSPRPGKAPRSFWRPNLHEGPSRRQRASLGPRDEPRLWKKRDLLVSRSGPGSFLGRAALLLQGTAGFAVFLQLLTVGFDLFGALAELLAVFT